MLVENIVKSILQQCFSRWAKAGHILSKYVGSRLQMNEAEMAYCAEVYAQKYKDYGGRMSEVRIFDKNGNPYTLKYPISWS